MIEFEIKFPEELKDLNLAANYSRARKMYLPRAMERSVAAARSAVAAEIPIGATGDAKRSIGATASQSPFQTVGKVQSSMRRPNVYIFVLNAGRPPGKRMADSRKLEPWVQAKGLANSPSEVRRIAYLIARSIQRKGTKGFGFFFRGLERTKNQIDGYHAQAVEDITRELGNA